MYSETGMIADCQNIYTSYINGTLQVPDSGKLSRKIDRMLATIQAMIRLKSEEGGNTVFLEKIQTDLQFIKTGIGSRAVRHA